MFTYVAFAVSTQGSASCVGTSFFCKDLIVSRIFSNFEQLKKLKKPKEEELDLKLTDGRRNGHVIGSGSCRLSWNQINASCTVVILRAITHRSGTSVLARSSVVTYQVVGASRERDLTVDSAITLMSNDYVIIRLLKTHCDKKSLIKTKEKRISVFIMS